MRAFMSIPVLLVVLLSSSAFAQSIDGGGPAQPSPLIDSVPVAVASVLAQPRWTDPQPSNAVKGAVIGLIVGAGVGLAFGVASCDGGCAGTEAALAALLGGAGACAGALVGSLARDRVEPGRVTRGGRIPAPAPGRVHRLSVTWRF